MTPFSGVDFTVLVFFVESLGLAAGDLDDLGDLGDLGNSFLFRSSSTE